MQAGLLWSDFDKITMKQLGMLIKRHFNHNQMNSEMRSLEHYNAHMNANRKTNTPYRKMHPELENRIKKENLEGEELDASATLAALEEVGVDVNSISS